MTTAIKAIVQPKIFVHLLTLMLSQNYMTFYFCFRSLKNIFSVSVQTTEDLNSVSQKIKHYFFYYFNFPVSLLSETLLWGIYVHKKLHEMVIIC